MDTMGRAGSPASFRDLTARIREAGLLDRRPVYYTARIALTFAAYGAGWAAFVAFGNSWALLPCAAGMAVLFTQVVFIGHDAGHRQISSSKRGNRLVGLVAGNLLTGVSLGWWVPKHNAHHAHPNVAGLDPDIGPGVVAFTFTAADAAGRRGVGRFIARHQAGLFLALVAVEGIGLHVTSADWLARRRDRSAVVETVLLVAHLAIYATVVFWVLPPLRAVAFIAVQQSLFGLYLGASFAPNHKSMPILDAPGALGFAAGQVITARNVRGGVMVDFLLGGLNRQIEHHLFPTMCRPNLVRAQPIVRAFCTEQGLPYCEVGIVESYRRTLRHLAAVSRSV